MRWRFLIRPITAGLLGRPPIHRWIVFSYESLLPAPLSFTISILRSSDTFLDQPDHRVA